MYVYAMLIIVSCSFMVNFGAAGQPPFVDVVSKRGTLALRRSPVRDGLQQITFAHTLDKNIQQEQLQQLARNTLTTKNTDDISCDALVEVVRAVKSHVTHVALGVLLLSATHCSICINLLRNTKLTSFGVCDSEQDTIYTMNVPLSTLEIQPGKKCIMIPQGPISTEITDETLRTLGQRKLRDVREDISDSVLAVVIDEPLWYRYQKKDEQCVFI